MSSPTPFTQRPRRSEDRLVDRGEHALSGIQTPDIDRLSLNDAVLAAIRIEVSRQLAVQCKALGMLSEQNLIKVLAEVGEGH